MKSIAIRNFVGSLPLVRSTLHSAPKYHVGSPIENQLGLQVLRVLSKKVGRSLRRGYVSGEVEARVRVLEKEGCLVLPNFLEPKQFETIVNEFDAINAGVPLEPYQGIENAKLYRRQFRLADFGP